MTHFVTIATRKYRFLGERLRDLGMPATLHVFTEKPMHGVHWYPREHKDWVSAVNDKYDCILSIRGVEPDDHVFWIDADTNLKKPLPDITGDLVGCQHFGDQTWMAKTKNFDLNPASTCYVPRDTKLPQMWYMGCLHGGKWSVVQRMYTMLKNLTLRNRQIGHEPGVNDESYLNWYFHYCPPTRVIPWAEFPFIVSDKGGHSCLR